METTWRVTKVTATPGLTLAELRQVEWFKTNPEYEARIDEVPTGDDFPDEFIDAEPGDPNGEFIESSGVATIDITDGPDLSPGDDVVLALSVSGRVPA